MTSDKTIIEKLGKDTLILLLHFLVLALSIVLIVAISLDTFHNINFSYEPRFLKLEYWVCVVFLADFFIELAFSHNKLSYLRRRFLFFLVSIPYVAIIHQMNWHFSPQIEYILRFVPLVRGGYALAMVIKWFTYNRATGLLLTYMMTLVATVYFASLVFFVFEIGVNPAVTDYDDALWWASMNVTTLGSNIIAKTAVGKVLAVVLGALGMMLFPVFTVYVTSLIKRQRQEDENVTLTTILKEIKQLKENNSSATSNGPVPSAPTTSNPTDEKS